MRRRDMLALAGLAAAVSAAPAWACRSPVAKDRNGYRRVIDGLFAAWWRRDFAAFSATFQHPAVAQPFQGRALFEQYFVERQRRQLGAILFNGASAVVQVVTPRGPDPELGICGGHAWADLVLVKFYPGLEGAVVSELRYLDGDTLAASEWRGPTGGRQRG